MKLTGIPEDKEKKGAESTLQDAITEIGWGGIQASKLMGEEDQGWVESVWTLKNLNMYQ